MMSTPDSSSLMPSVLKSECAVGLQQSLHSRLRAVLGEDQIESNESELESRSHPWNSYHRVDTRPQLILTPSNTQQVAAIVKICAEYSVPIIPYGGGTSLEGQTLAVGRVGVRPVSLDFNKMKRVIDLNEHDMDVTVQAGLGYIELNEWLSNRAIDLWFPLDPGPGASIGGMCACRCSGSTAVRYGSMRDNVLNLTVVTAAGEIIKTGTRARKSSAGYDLTRLFIGSEGTLGVITEATLKLHLVPKHSHAVLLSFPTEEAAVLTARDSLRSGVTIGRCELLDTNMVAVMNAANPTDKHWPECVTLMYEVTGNTEQECDSAVSVVEAAAKAQGATASSVYRSKEECTAIWKRRKECLWSCLAAYPNRECMITDACVPLTALPALAKQCRELMEASGLPCPVVAHAGDGNFHVFIMFNPDDPDEVTTAKQLAAGMARLAIKLGGTCTGEHGIGVGKIDLLEEELGEGAVGVMRAIKDSLDPKEILNPGKVLRQKPEMSRSK
jgi:D-lactate dehydrogenase (cytochrome)